MLIKKDLVQNLSDLVEDRKHDITRLTTKNEHLRELVDLLTDQRNTYRTIAKKLPKLRRKMEEEREFRIRYQTENDQLIRANTAYETENTRLIHDAPRALMKLIWKEIQFWRR